MMKADEGLRRRVKYGNTYLYFCILKITIQV